MRYKKFISEETNAEKFNELISFIYKNCMPYVSEAKNIGEGRLFSGRSGSRDTFIDSVRKDRKPVDMPFDMHNMLDDTFYKKFGFKARSNSLFVTGSHTTATDYGHNVYMIIPIGNFQLIYSNEIRDLYTWLNKDVGRSVFYNWCGEHRKEVDVTLKKRLIEKGKDPEDRRNLEQEFLLFRNGMEDFEKWRSERMEKLIPKAISKYKKNGLAAAIKSEHEIMLHCDKYLAIRDAIYGDDVVEYIVENGTKGPV